MGKRIKNRLSGVSIGGNYIGGDVIVDGYADQETAGTGSKSIDKTIFLSYNWHDGEKIGRAHV